MKFPQAFEIMLEGGSCRRASLKDTRLVRVVDPNAEPEMDGPAEVYLVVTEQGRPVGRLGSHSEEAAAVKSLEDAKVGLHEAWDTYQSDNTAWLGATPAEREQLPKPHTPSLRKDYFDRLKVVKRKAPRLNRVTGKFLVAMDSAGALSVYTPSNSDLFATDWQKT